jgi:hypothetical protein
MFLQSSERYKLYLPGATYRLFVCVVFVEKFNFEDLRNDRAGQLDYLSALLSFLGHSGRSLMLTKATNCIF